MTLLRLVFGFGLGLCLAAQTDDVFTVGKVGVRLGEEQQMVLSSLRTNYDVTGLSANTWIVAEKAAGLQKVGTVTFENGRLATVGSNWSESSDSNTVEFAKQFVAAVRHQGVESPQTAVIRAIHSGTPADPVDGVEILIGSRVIKVVTSAAVENGRPIAGYASVSEELHNNSFATSMRQSAGLR